MRSTKRMHRTPRERLASISSSSGAGSVIRSVGGETHESTRNRMGVRVLALSWASADVHHQRHHGAGDALPDDALQPRQHIERGEGSLWPARRHGRRGCLEVHAGSQYGPD